jgi:signal transduction histidine kinase
MSRFRFLIASAAGCCAAIAVWGLAVMLVAGAFVTIAAFRQDVNSSLDPALAETTQLMKTQKLAGRSLRDAGIFAWDHLGRPNLVLTVNDPGPRTLFTSGKFRDWRDSTVGMNAGLLGMSYRKRYVPGGKFYLDPNSSRLVDEIGSGFQRVLPAMFLAIVLAYGLTRLIVVRATRPLRDVARALDGLGAGDIVPRPIADSDAPEISALTAAYNSAANDVRKAVADRQLVAENVRTFISDASHELNTPLTIIMGYVDAVSEGIVNEPRDAERILKKTLTKCRHMRGTIEKLIALARLDREQANVTTFDLAALTRQITDSMVPLLPALQLDISTGGNDTLVAGDENDIREAIVSIIDNAVKYAPRSPVDVRVTSTGEVVVVEIADAGPGMTAEDRDRAFERFHRGSRRGTVEGSGLGLAIAKRAVQRANGSVTLTSAPGRGTTVKLYLPVAAVSLGLRVS